MLYLQLYLWEDFHFQTFPRLLLFNTSAKGGVLQDQMSNRYLNFYAYTCALLSRARFSFLKIFVYVYVTEMTSACTKVDVRYIFEVIWKLQSPNESFLALLHTPGACFCPSINFPTFWVWNLVKCDHSWIWAIHLWFQNVNYWNGFSTYYDSTNYSDEDYVSEFYYISFPLTWFDIVYIQMNSNLLDGLRDAESTICFTK